MQNVSSGRGNPKVTEVILEWLVHLNSRARIGSGRQHLADALNRATLVVIYRQEFKTIVQALAIAHNGTQLHRLGTQRKLYFHGNDFARFQVSSESATDAILSEFTRASPEMSCACFSGNRNRHPHVQRMTRITSFFVC